MRTSLIAAVIVVSIPSVAHADSLKIQLIAAGSSDMITVGGVGHVKHAAEIKKIKDETNRNPQRGIDATLYADSLDLLNNALGPQTVVDQTLGDTPTASLYTQFADASHLSSTRAAGLQLAIRNALYDDDYTVKFVAGNANKLYLQNDWSIARAHANEFLDRLLTVAALTERAALLDTAFGPDQSANPAPVAERTTLVLVASALGAFAAMRWMDNISNRKGSVFTRAHGNDRVTLRTRPPPCVRLRTRPPKRCWTPPPRRSPVRGPSPRT